MRTVNVIEAIYFAALDKKIPGERAAYLDDACKDDTVLRRCVERMLDAAPKLGDFLQPPTAAPPRSESPAIEECSGSVIGPYKLLQQLGEGGFGVVFMAEQEHPVRRRVALKIIKPGMDSKQVIARFEAERQALALMDHPNIARVLDGGTTDSGRPYFVMELVKGVPITEFSDKHRLAPRERLELFIQVCNAVQHAHQKGVIHRDIKPSNVLVTMYDDNPVPKVIDFGVAKAIEQKLTEQTMFTRVGQVIGTLEYMSPEQATLNALDVDTRSDVYALGVLLYELLTGTTPLSKEQLEGVAFLEMLRLIREEEPPKPSTRLTQSGDALPVVALSRKSDSQKLQREVRGELDWITMKALEKDRCRRYGTASALAADVQRYLKDEHVEACPPTVGYRLGKYARKHKALISSMSAIAALLLIGITATSWLAVRAGNAEELANDRLEMALKNEDKAKKSEKAAETERDATKRERDALNLARQELRRTHYAAALNAIPGHWRANNLKRVVELLDQQRPGPGEVDLRGIEWHYWDRMCNAEVRSTTVTGTDAEFAAFSGDGRRCAVWASEKEAKIVDLEKGGAIILPVDETAGFAAMNRDGSRFAYFAPRLDPETKAHTDEGKLVVMDVPSGKTVFVRKTGSSTRMVLSPDGKRMATLEGGVTFGPPRGEPLVIRVWDLANPDRDPISMVHEATQSTAHVAFSPDGARLAGTIYRWGPVGAAKGFPAPSTIHIWDVGNGTSRAHTTTKLVVSQIEFTPDGARLVGAAADPPGAVNKSEAKEKAAKTGTSLPVPRGNHTCVWGGADGEELTLLRSTPLPAFDGRGMGLFSFHLSPDGRQLAAWGYSRRNNITLIDVDTGEERQVVKCIDMPHPVAFNADGSRLLAAVVDPRDAVPTRVTVNAWTVQQDKPAPPLPKGKLSGSREVAVWSTDRERQAVFEFGFGGTKITADISIRDKSGKVLHVFREHTGPLANAEFNANRSLVCSWTREGQVKVWETDTGKVRWSGARPPFKTNIDGSPVLGPASVVRNQRFLVLPEGKAVRIVAFDDLREILKIDNVTLGRLHFSPDSKRLVTAVGRVADGIAQMKLWDLETGREIQAVPAEFTHLQFSADSKWFALAMSTAPQRDGRIVVWNAVTGTKRAELTDHQSFRGQGMSRMMAFSPDGTRLAVASDSGPIGSSLPAVYDIPAEKIVFRLEALADPMSSLAFSPDGKRIVTGTGRFERREIRIWDASTGRELLSVEHDRPIPRVEFSPDGHRLIPRGVGPSAVILDGTPREALKKSH